MKIQKQKFCENSKKILFFYFIGGGGGGGGGVRVDVNGEVKLM